VRFPAVEPTAAQYFTRLFWRYPAAVTEGVRGVVGQLCSHLTRDTVDNMARIAAIPLDIRGFGPVKLAAVTEVRERVGSALDCL
jgi:hypothetical protein